MFPTRSLFTPVIFLSALSLLQGCSDAQEGAAPAAPDTVATVTVEPAAEPDVTDTAIRRGNGPAEESAPASEAAPDTVAGAEDDDPIDPESLEPVGEIELTQYTVAYVGSGTMGGGTLTIDGESHPFKIVGLGVGGLGASVLDATGVVYNLPSLEAFPGTYGNARLGMTAGESGSGKLWLRNPDGVVIELESQMRGLALSSGVDGMLIQWDEEEESTTDRVMDDTEEVVGKGIEAGADAVEKGIGKVKGWINKEGD